jgi:hypothetical protein
MKKYAVFLAGLVVAVCLAGQVFAQTLKAKEEVTGTKSGVTATEKETLKTKTGTETIKETTTTTPTSKEVTATVTEKPKTGDLLKETVTFNSYSDAEGGTITVIKDNKEIKMPARNYSSWKQHVIGKEKSQITIYSTYDPQLLKRVVTKVEPAATTK